MGILKKLININTWYYILILAGIAFMLYMTFGFPNVDAISRAEYNELENSLEQYETQLSDIRITIEEKRILVSDQEDKIELLEDTLRAMKSDSGGTWDEQIKIIDYESQITTEKNILQTETENFFDLFDIESGYIIEIKKLEEKLQHAEIYSPPSLAHFDRKIGVVLSQTCITMIKNDFNTTCPTYKDLVILDSSLTEVSGKFVTDDDGFFHRSEPSQINSWRYYDFDNEIRLFIDPPHGMAERMKLITLQPNFDTYKVTEDLTEGDYGSENQFGTVLYHDRYIDDCKYATLNADKWEMLLPDTIHFMRNNCDRDHTSYQEREVINATKTEIDITTSPNWQYAQWLEEVSNFCIFKFRQC